MLNPRHASAGWPANNGLGPIRPCSHKDGSEDFLRDYVDQKPSLSGCMQGTLVGLSNGVAKEVCGTVLTLLLRSPKWGSMVELTPKA